MSLNNVNQVVKSGLCLECGLCAKADGKTGVHQKKDPQFPIKLCPGAEEHNSMGKTHHEILFGQLLSAFLVQKNGPVDDRSSSTGVISALAKHALKEGVVEHVLTADFKYEHNKVRAFAKLINSPEEIDNAAGSKYCSVDYSELRTLNFKTSLLLICTPCMVAPLKSLVKEMGVTTVYTFSNFCGGFKNYRALDTLIGRLKKENSQITRFSFRGSGQPGKLSLESSDSTITHPYPDYVKLTGYGKVKRCTLCTDATGELSDLSFGDAWGIQHLYPKKEEPCSTVIVRNKKGSELWTNFLSENSYIARSVALEEIEKSQRGLLSTKKYRQAARLIVFSWLRRTRPELKNYFTSVTPLHFEVKVLLTHSLNRVLEDLRLYTFFGSKGIFHRIIARISRHHYE